MKALSRYFYYLGVASAIMFCATPHFPVWTPFAGAVLVGIFGNIAFYLERKSS